MIIQKQKHLCMSFFIYSLDYTLVCTSSVSVSSHKAASRKMRDKTTLFRNVLYGVFKENETVLQCQHTEIYPLQKKLKKIVQSHYSVGNPLVPAYAHTLAYAEIR